MFNRKQWSKFPYKCYLPPLMHELDAQNLILMLTERKMDIKLEVWIRGSSSQLVSRSSRPEALCRKGVHKNFSKFTEKHLCQSLRPATLLKKRLWHRCLPVNFEKILRRPFLFYYTIFYFTKPFEAPQSNVKIKI